MYTSHKRSQLFPHGVKKLLHSVDRLILLQKVSRNTGMTNFKLIDCGERLTGILFERKLADPNERVRNAGACRKYDKRPCAASDAAFPDDRDCASHRRGIFNRGSPKLLDYNFMQDRE